MATIVPNAGDTTGGNKYEALDQAEPDALDFELLGLTGNGVVSGCAVTSNSSSTNVAVAAGVVVVAGVAYAVSANSALGLPAAPADNRFDLVIARVASGVASLVVVSGDNSATNPEFPRSASVLTGSPSPTANFYPTTDVVLAALYRTGASAVTASRIVDKRAFRTSSIVNQGTSTPSGDTHGGTGSLYLDTTTPNGTESGVFVHLPGGWVELAQNVGPHLPVGAAVVWPSVQAVPSGCIEANGQALSTAAYPDLFAAYGYTHGGSGGSFNVPNYNGKFIRGTTNTSLVGTNVGADNVILTEANLPAHVHTITHTHSFAHTHDSQHSHSLTLNSGGSHLHDKFTSWDGFVMVKHSGTFYPHLQVAESTTSNRYVFAIQNGGVSNQFGPTSTTASTPAHTHTGLADTVSATSTSQSTSTTGAASNTNSGSVGSGSAVSLVPASQYARWIVRATLGTGSASSGAPASGISVENDNALVSDEITTLDFSDEFSVATGPDGEANIELGVFGAVRSFVATNASAGSTEDLDVSLFSIFDITMDQNCTFSFTNPPAAGQSIIFTLYLRGAFTPTFPPSVEWPDGTPPTYTSPSLYVFSTVDEGTSWQGAQVGKAFA